MWKIKEYLDLSIAKSARDHRAMLRVLQMVKLSGGKMMATDMEQYYVCPTPFNHLDICVDLTKLTQVLGAIKGQEYDIEQCGTSEDPKITITADDGSKFTLNGMPGGEFVALPDWDNESTTVVSAKDLYTGIKAVSFAVMDRNFSPVLCGIYVRTDGDKLKFVGTDSFRLAEYAIDWDNTKNDTDFIVHKKHTITLLKMLSKYKDTDKDVIINKYGNMVRFSIDDEFMICHNIQGKYPEYDNPNIMPHEYVGDMLVDRKVLLEMLKRHTIFNGDINNYIEREGGHITSNGDGGECYTFMETIQEGVIGKFWVNAKYITSALKREVPDMYDQVKIHIADNAAQKPITFDIAPGLRYVVRPLIK